MPEPTSEQLRIRQIREGINIAAANAGTGKTHSLAELVAEIYEHEERKLFQKTGERVTGKDQLRILRQIQAVTFTRDAAQEFNSRILGLLQERGIPMPTQWDRPYPVCRTLDSYILGWFKKPRVFGAWMKVDPDFSQAIARAMSVLSPTAADQLQGRGPSRMLSFFKKWNWIVGGEVSDMVLDCIIRESDEHERIRGIPSLDTWQERWLKWLGDFSPASASEPGRPANWGQGFWDALLTPYRAYQREMRELKDRMTQGRLASDPNYKALAEDIHRWEQINITKREFNSVYELARARGYHPVRYRERMMSLPVMRELAASDFLFSFSTFHAYARRFYLTKVTMLFLDHTDLLNLFVEATEQDIAILERDREYPTLGVRAKYTLFDEAQDNNQFQNRIVELWRADNGVPYCTVACGDVKQAIYGFKGASSYGFAGMIDRVKKSHPENFFTLTCSFRSLTEIVAFGNEIVQTLPHYKDTVYPSSTIYTEPGRIVVMPPVATDVDEARLVFEELKRVLETTSDSVMVIHRNNLHSHPITPLIESLGPASNRVKAMTIHRSKGLQADHVFVMGLTSGCIPDVRASYTQEVNLFYVACTRPRKALYVSAPYTRTRINHKTGELEQEKAGPSVFFARLPRLRALADRVGWDSSLITWGEEVHKTGHALHLARTSARERSLRAWWRRFYPEIPIKESDDDEPVNETGGAPAPEEIKKMAPRTIWRGGEVQSIMAGRSVAAAGDAKASERLMAKLRTAYLKNGEVPRFLSRDEFLLALRSKWIFKGAGGRNEFTSNFASISTTTAR